MSNSSTFSFQAIQGRLPVANQYCSTHGLLDSYPIWGSPVEAPDANELRDIFESTHNDTNLNAMRDLARQMGPVGHQPKTRQAEQEPTKAKSKVRDTPEAAKVNLKDMSEAEKYDHYKAMIEDHGGKFRTKPGRRNLLSLRNNTNTHANQKQGRYDDVTIMLWTDKQGGKHVRRYRSNTEPAARFEGVYGKDANGDGRLDQVRMKAGYNEYYVSSSDRLGRVLRPSRATRGEVDVNHDGRFTKADGKKRISSGDYSMLFHAGGETGTGSAGCQTMPPKRFDRFWRDLTRGGNQGRIGYTIIDRP